MTRHYQQNDLYIRGAIIAQSERPIIQIVRAYNHKVDQVRKINLNDLAENPSVLTQEFVYQGSKGLEIRIRPPWFTTELNLAGRPGSNRGTWIYFIEKPNSRILVGVNVLGLDKTLADENLDEIIRATSIVEIDSTAADVEQYMRKRIA